MPRPSDGSLGSGLTVDLGGAGRLVLCAEDGEFEGGAGDGDFDFGRLGGEALGVDGQVAVQGRFRMEALTNFTSA